MTFFRELYRNCKEDGYLEIRSLPDRRQFWLEERDVPDKLLALKTNLFFGVGLRSRKEGTADAVSSIPALWMDMDAKDFGGDMSACAHRLWDGFQWHAIVRTGGGFHAYRRLAVPASTTEGKNLLISSMKELAKRIGGDRAACDTARILRVPNTKNLKYQPARVVELKYQNWKLPDLTEDELRELGPEIYAPEKMPISSETPEEIRMMVSRCPFLKHCEDQASTLSEPEWYAWISNVCGFHMSPRYIHEISRRYPRYSPSETDRKILHALDDSAPITCARIKGYWDCGRVCGVKSPAGLAWQVAAPEVAASPNPFRRKRQKTQGLGISSYTAERVLAGLRRLCKDAD